MKTETLWLKAVYHDIFYPLSECLLEVRALGCQSFQEGRPELIFMPCGGRGTGRVRVEILLLHSVIPHPLLIKKMHLFRQEI